MHTHPARRRISGLVIGLALLLGLVGISPAAAAGRATATEVLNVRAAASTSARVVGTLERGERVVTRGTSKGWTTIDYRQRTAYVATRYLTVTAPAPAPAPPAYVAGTVRTTTSDLNVRRGAGTSHPVLRVLADGSRTTMTGRASNGFAEVVAGRTTGWVSASYLGAVSRALPAVVGTRVATVTLDIRTGPGASASTVAEVKRGTRLAVTGVRVNGRAQVVYRSAARWVTAKYLVTAAEPSAPALPRVTGTRYATTTLDIRSSSADSSTTITEVPRGTKLSITGVVTNGRMQVVFNRAVRWVTAKYLSTTKPAVQTGTGSAAEKGLKPNAIKVHRGVRATFPQITTIYGVRRDAIPDHPSGRALDLMLPNYRSKAGQALGYKLRDWARANAKRLGIQYVIFNQRIWNIQRDGEGWRYMAGRGSDSANHVNHIHITVY